MSDITEFADWEEQNRTLAEEQRSQEEQRIREVLAAGAELGERDSSNELEAMEETIDEEQTRKISEGERVVYNGSGTLECFSETTAHIMLEEEPLDADDEREDTDQDLQRPASEADDTFGPERTETEDINMNTDASDGIAHRSFSASEHAMESEVEGSNHDGNLSASEAENIAQLEFVNVIEGNKRSDALGQIASENSSASNIVMEDEAIYRDQNESLVIDELDDYEVLLVSDVEDPFEDYDVSPEEKPFLLEALGVMRKAIPAPPSIRVSAETTLSDARVVFDTSSRVQEFAREHPFYNVLQEAAAGFDDAFVEFKDDVRAFALAAGMEIGLADTAVTNAQAHWAASIGLPRDVVLDDLDLVSIKALMNSPGRAPKLVDAKDYYPKVAQIEMIVLTGTPLAGPQVSGKKRKLEALGTEHNEKAALAHASKKQKKKAKKEEKRRKRAMNEVKTLKQRQKQAMKKARGLEKMAETPSSNGPHSESTNPIVDTVRNSETSEVHEPSIVSSSIVVTTKNKRRTSKQNSSTSIYFSNSDQRLGDFITAKHGESSIIHPISIESTKLGKKATIAKVTTDGKAPSISLDNAERHKPQRGPSSQSESGIDVDHSALILGSESTLVEVPEEHSAYADASKQEGKRKKRRKKSRNQNALPEEVRLLSVSKLVAVNNGSGRTDHVHSKQLQTHEQRKDDHSAESQKPMGQRKLARASKREAKRAARQNTSKPLAELNDANSTSPPELRPPSKDSIDYPGSASGNQRLDIQDAEQVDQSPEVASLESLGGGYPLTDVEIIEESISLQSITEGVSLAPLEASSAENDSQDLEKYHAPSKNKRKRAPAKSPYFSPTKINSKDCLPHETGSPVLPRPPTNHGSLESNATPPHTPKQNPAHSSTQLRPRPSPRGCLSCIPFPPLDSPTFGLIQERLAHDPFRLLIAVTFLIRTHGKHAIPVFFELMTRYPTPESLIGAEKTDIVAIIRHLGLQNQRAATYQTYAQIWLNNPPVKGKRYPVKDYPTKGAGRSISKEEEFISDEDEREAWEIGHMTQGPYALDSWRIFCRDVCRGLTTGWNGEGCTEEGFQPEWMRVLPGDKELRAYLRWMWLKEGFAWDPLTGDKDVASPELLRAAMEGRIAWDDEGGMTIFGPKVDQQMTEQSL